MATTNTIDRLDYPRRSSTSPSPEHRPLLARSQSSSYFFDRVAAAIQTRDRQRKSILLQRYTAYLWALLMCLGAGSITAFSLYAPLFQKRLGYSQFRVNGIAIAAEIATYAPVPAVGIVVDRYGPRGASVGSGVLFGVGYGVAAAAYRAGKSGDGAGYAGMILGFVLVGMSTSAMYLAAVTTCAKNFGRGKHKGLALALPIAAFGLSGMWQSQIGSRLLFERREDGSRGDVDVFRYFLFLGGLLLGLGLVGGVALRIVGEEEMINEAVEELERSGLLEDSEFFRPREQVRGYGTVTIEERDAIHDEMNDQKAQMLRDQEKKRWLLNEETRRFLGDRTMWLLAFGFFLVTGPGEAFINNLGTIIDTLQLAAPEASQATTDAATHVSIVAIMSTVARIFTGTLSDLLAPVAPQHQHRRGPNSLANSAASIGALEPPPAQRTRFYVSRVVFLITFSLILSAGQVLLASGVIQGHAERFWLVSAAVGAGYGAIFSLTPIIISVVWGVENFGTNWGIVATVPAVGATIWGLVYAGVYQAAADKAASISEGASDVLCHGQACYSSTFWGMAISVWVACIMWIWAWRGQGGWLKRSIAV